MLNEGAEGLSRVPIQGHRCPPLRVGRSRIVGQGYSVIWKESTGKIFHNVLGYSDPQAAVSAAMPKGLAGRPDEPLWLSLL